MNHLSYLAHTVIFILLVGCAGQDKNTAANTGQLNVLFIIADDLNCDLGAYGNNIIKTPNIDRLAKSGVVFENAHNQYPLCGPSRASFMTGMYTEQTQITKNNIFLRSSIPDVITLGQRFRQQGYQSVELGKFSITTIPVL